MNVVTKACNTIYASREDSIVISRNERENMVRVEEIRRRRPTKCESKYERSTAGSTDTSEFPGLIIDATSMTQD